MIKIGEKLMNVFNFNYDDEYDDDYDDSYDDDYDDDIVKSSSARSSSRSNSASQRTSSRNSARTASSASERRSAADSDSSRQKNARQTRTTAGKVIPIKSNKATSGSGMSVQVIKPVKFEDSLEIVDILLRGRSVIINVEGMNIETAQKIIDFVSGAAYSIQGNLQMITNYIIIVTPYGVDLSGDFNEFIRGGLDSSVF